MQGSDQMLLLSLNALDIVNKSQLAQIQPRDTEAMATAPGSSMHNMTTLIKR